MINPSIRAVFNITIQDTYIANCASLAAVGIQTNLSVTGSFDAALMSTSLGQVSCATATWVPIFQPSVACVYILIVRIYNYASAQTSATATLFNSYFDLTMLNKAVGSAIDLRVNYPNIEVQQTTGSTKLVDFSVIRML